MRNLGSPFVLSVTLFLLPGGSNRFSSGLMSFFLVFSFFFFPKCFEPCLFSYRALVLFPPPWFRIKTRFSWLLKTSSVSTFLTSANCFPLACCSHCQLKEKQTVPIEQIRKKASLHCRDSQLKNILAYGKKAGKKSDHFLRSSAPTYFFYVLW